LIEARRRPIFEHPEGRELRVFLEPLERDDVLHTLFSALDLEPLESKAAAFAEQLRAQGWWPLDA
jgi:hypothetical protein